MFNLARHAFEVGSGTRAEEALANLLQMSSAQVEMPRTVARSTLLTSEKCPPGNPKSPSPNVPFVARGDSDCDSDSDDEDKPCLGVFCVLCGSPQHNKGAFYVSRNFQTKSVS